MALNMNRAGDHFLNEEFCFFDGKRKRCRGFVTLTASVYHPLLRKQITLAIMECESENTLNVTLFWTCLMKCLKSCLKTKEWNSTLLGGARTWLGQKKAGIADVFGEEGKMRIISCEFHFKEHWNRMSKRLDPDSAYVFRNFCNWLLECNTGRLWQG